jgi:hypothetical protein
MKTHLEMTTPLFHLIVWSSVFLLFLLSTARKLFLAVLVLRRIRRKWLSNFPSSRHKSSVSQPVTELANRCCCGVSRHNITAERGPYQAQFLCVSAFILPFVISVNIRPSHSPVYIELHCCKLHFYHAATRISRHLCPWQAGGSRLILRRVLCTYLAVFQDRDRWPAVVSAVVNIRVA